MKKCMICGWDESDDSKFTCPACGEASWKPEAEPAQAEPAQAAADPEPAAPAKRGPGRPRKTS